MSWFDAVGIIVATLVGFPLLAWIGRLREWGRRD